MTTAGERVSPGGDAAGGGATALQTRPKTTLFAESEGDHYRRKKATNWRPARYRRPVGGVRRNRVAR